MLPKRARRRSRRSSPPREERGVAWDDVQPWVKTDWAVLAAWASLALLAGSIMAASRQLARVAPGPP